MSLDQTVIENSNRAALVHHSLRVLVTHIGQEEAWLTVAATDTARAESLQRMGRIGCFFGWQSWWPFFSSLERIRHTSIRVEGLRNLRVSATEAKHYCSCLGIGGITVRNAEQ